MDAKTTQDKLEKCASQLDGYGSNILIIGDLNQLVVEKIAPNDAIVFPDKLEKLEPKKLNDLLDDLDSEDTLIAYSENPNSIDMALKKRFHIIEMKFSINENKYDFSTEKDYLERI